MKGIIENQKKGWRIECPSQYIAQIMAEHIIKSNDNRFKIDEVCLHYDGRPSVVTVLGSHKADKEFENMVRKFKIK